MIKPKVYIRADGNSEIGLGHVTRSIALVQMLRKDFSCVFATRFLTDFLRKEIQAVCDNLVELPETDEHFVQFLNMLTGDEIVVLDNYFFDTPYQQAVKDKGCKLVCIDDIHDKHFVADVVINHAGGIEKSDYSAEPYTLFCLGPQYALLRSAFLEAAPKRSSFTDNNNLLICLGGADPYNYTLEVLQTLHERKSTFHCCLVLGNAYLHRASLDAFLQQSLLNVRIYQNLEEQEMVTLMQQCAQAILPPSTVSMEYLTVRNGKLYLKQIADNQKDIYSFYIDEGIGYDVSGLLENDEQSDRQKTYFDGQSALRLLKIFKRLAEERQLSLRNAELSDMDLYFHWANDLSARQTAVNPKPITMEEHVVWFRARLGSADSHLWVMQKEGSPVGQIRFDIARDKQEATISYFIDEKHRGKGLGLLAVKLGLELIIRMEKDIKTIRAIVKQGNDASRKVFERLNFQEGIPAQMEGFIEYRAQQL